MVMSNQWPAFCMPFHCSVIAVVISNIPFSFRDFKEISTEENGFIDINKPLSYRYYFFFLFRVSLNPASINISPGTRQSRSQRRNGPKQSPALVRWFDLLPRSRVLPPPRWSRSKHDHYRWSSINAMIFNPGTNVNSFICEIWFRQYAFPGRVGVKRGKRGRLQRPSPCEEALSEGLQRWKWDCFLF